MPKRSSKHPADVNQLAANIAETVTGGEPEYVTGEMKNPAAVALGRLGGLKGGKARAEKLSPRRRTEIARKAAQSRWAAKAERDA